MARNTHDANRLWLALGVVVVALVLWVLFAPSDSNATVEEPVQSHAPVAAVLYDLATRNGSADTAPTVNSTGVDTPSPNLPAGQLGDQARASTDAPDQVLGAVVENHRNLVEHALGMVEGGLDVVVREIDEAVSTGVAQSNNTAGRGQRLTAG